MPSPDALEFQMIMLGSSFGLNQDGFQWMNRISFARRNRRALLLLIKDKIYKFWNVLLKPENVEVPTIESRSGLSFKEGFNPKSL